jgi:hypothetical protein
MRKKLKIGDRVRAKVRTMDGWKGTGTYIGDGMVLTDFKDTIADFSDCELAKIRDQIPNPSHNAFIAESKDSFQIRARVNTARYAALTALIAGKITQ